MKLIDFSLSVKGKILLDNVTVCFKEGTINHLLGKNGVGKSCLAKSIVGAMKHKGRIEYDAQTVSVIGSYTNIPGEFRVVDIYQILSEKFEGDIVSELKVQLDVSEISTKSRYRNLSDGQKQKLKLLYFLAGSPSLIILDEFTTALDKKTCNEIYNFLQKCVEEKGWTIVNITHNLADINNLEGAYFLIDDKKIIPGLSRDEVVRMYIQGEV